MKILLFADLHMCPRSSIVNKWGTIYPQRLENCIQTMNWVERTAEELDCNMVVGLGDFFDRPDLNSETITALMDISWAKIPHTFIVGNHDASTSSLEFNAVNCLKMAGCQVLTKATVIEAGNSELCFLPYVTESERQSLDTYFGAMTNKKRILFAHTDISGIQMGPVVSKTGFPLEELEAGCSLCFNGHLHNGHQVSSKVINLGNLTGRDFGEDAFRYEHRIAILDTDSLEIQYIENPYALNFYKVNLESEDDIEILANLKANAVVSVGCPSSILTDTRNFIDSLGKRLLETRVTTIFTGADTGTSEAPALDLSVDHLARFIECCRNNIDNTPILEAELNEICK